MFLRSLLLKMNILVIGAAGMVGRKLCDVLAKSGDLGGHSIDQLTMADTIAAIAPSSSSIPVRTLASDISRPGAAQTLLSDRPQLIYHLAAVVSGEAEADFDKGYRVNLTASQLLFEAVREAGYRPRIVFASSIAVFGVPFPEVIPEDFAPRPLTSYGAQKAMVELLLADFSRRNFLDGIGIRLPTICVRPGKPNQAASSFFSNIIREPLKGEPAILPVTEQIRHWFASPRSAVGFLLHAATIDLYRLGSLRILNMPGVSATIEEMIASLKRLGGLKCVNLILRRPDAMIQKIVDGWPRRLDASRAQILGFRAEKSFDEIILAHIEDESIAR
jgi:nucleoside-diphosphate-sugar epimerase